MPQKKREMFHGISVFNSSKPYILILGGYGYANVGDEAQLNMTLKDLKHEFPDYDLIVLSPNVEYTQKEHSCLSTPAPRVAFFDRDIDGYYSLQTDKDKHKFLKNALKVYLTAVFDKYKIPVCLVTDKRTSLLSAIKGASMVYFSGGGYLTGKTLSRLWDGCLFVLLAKIYAKPVVMSGQTIGLFRNWFDRFVSKVAFSRVDLITVRDMADSLNDLKSIGVYGDNVYATFDDAMFCDAVDIETLKVAMPMINFDKKYIALQFHYWGITDDNTRIKLIDNIHSMVQQLLLVYDYNIVLFGMHSVDFEALSDYMKLYARDRVLLSANDSNFKVVRGLIANSELCITMKHHPIIFSLGENVPVVSLAYDQYYVHKNKGALAIFGLERNNVDITENFKTETIVKLIQDVLQGRDATKVKVEKILLDLRNKRVEFMKRTKDIMRYNYREQHEIF